MLAELECEVIGPAPNMAIARILVEEGGYDAALMDIHIRGERVFPLCEMMEARSIPFVFTSGYADWHMLEKWGRPPAASEALYASAGRRGPEAAIRLAYIMLLVVVPAGEPPIVCDPPVTEPPEAICCWTAWVS
jgi:hypothetical protein